MSTRVVSIINLEISVTSEVSGEDVLRRVTDEVVTSLQKQIHAGAAISPEIEVDFLRSRVEVNSITTMKVGTGDMDK